MTWELGYFQRRREHIQDGHRLIRYLCGHCGACIEKVVDELSEEEYNSLHPEECIQVEAWMQLHGLNCESENGPIDWI